MRDFGIHRNVVRHLASGEGFIPSHFLSQRSELPPEVQKYLHILGPIPKQSLETLADLGLSDDEIARYFRMPCRLVTELREIWKIDGIP